MQITDRSELKKYWPLSDDLVLHRNVANLVYFSKIENLEVVVRLTPVNQRTQNEIKAELDDSTAFSWDKNSRINPFKF